MAIHHVTRAKFPFIGGPCSLLPCHDLTLSCAYEPHLVMQEASGVPQSPYIPASKRPCFRFACPHRVLTSVETEDLERYLLSQMSLLAETIPSELLQCQLATGHLLPVHVVRLLVRRLLASRTAAAAVLLHRILQQNLELAREHDKCDVEEHDSSLPQGEVLPPKCPSLWSFSDLQECVSGVQEACSEGSALPIGPQLFLQYVLGCMGREGDLQQREALWMPCREALAELLLYILPLAAQGVPLCGSTTVGCPPLDDLLIEILMCGQVSALAHHRVCVLLLSAVEQLSSFVALRAFLRTLHHRDLRMQLTDMVLSTKFSPATAAEGHPPAGHYSQQPSLQRTLTEHFLRLPDPEAVGMWSSCACLLMLLCYLVQCHLEAPGLDPAHSRQAIRAALHRLTEHLSEDTRLFSQLTSPDCWFYLQYLTCLTGQTTHS